MKKYRHYYSCMFAKWYIIDARRKGSGKSSASLKPHFQFLQLLPFLCLKSFFPPAAFCRFTAARPLNPFCAPNFLPPAPVLGPVAPVLLPVAPVLFPANLFSLSPFLANFLPPSLFINLLLPSTVFLSPKRFPLSLVLLSDVLKVCLSLGGAFPGDIFLFLKGLGDLPGLCFLFAPGNMSKNEIKNVCQCKLQQKLANN